MRESVKGSVGKSVSKKSGSIHPYIDWINFWCVGFQNFFLLKKKKKTYPRILLNKCSWIEGSDIYKRSNTTKRERGGSEKAEKGGEGGREEGGIHSIISLVP